MELRRALLTPPKNNRTITIMTKKTAIILLLGLSIKAGARHTPSGSETTEESVNVDSIIRKTQKKVNLEFRSNEDKKSLYYLRMSEGEDPADGNGTPSAEALIEAKSYICLRDIRVCTGRDHGMKEDTLPPLKPYWTRNEFCRILQTAPMIAGDPYWWGTRTPLIYRPRKLDINRLMYYGTIEKAGTYPKRKVYYGNVYSGHEEEGFASDRPDISLRGFNPEPVSTRYHTSGQTVRGNDGNILTEVVLQSMFPDSYDEMVGTLCLDGNLHLLSFDGQLLGKSLWVIKEGKRNAVRLDCRIHIDYTRERGFDEIGHSRCEIGYGNEKTTIELFKVEGSRLKLRKKVPLDGNLSQAVHQAGYNPELWENQVVRKAIEESTDNRQP